MYKSSIGWCCGRTGVRFPTMLTYILHSFYGIGFRCLLSLKISLSVCEGRFCDTVSTWFLHKVSGGNWCLDKLSFKIVLCALSKIIMPDLSAFPRSNFVLILKATYILFCFTTLAEYRLHQNIIDNCKCLLLCHTTVLFKHVN